MAKKYVELVAPIEADEMVLHVCCAPCSGAQIKKIVDIGIKPTLYFYNPNIHPKAEYEIRKEELLSYGRGLGLEAIDADYDSPNWFAKTRGYELEPEKGKRCSICFDIRLLETARFTKERGLKLFSSSLATSRHKDQEQILRSAEFAEQKYGVHFLKYNWRKGGGQELALKISRENNFYRQNYCGCIYSKRDSDAYRERKRVSSE